MLISQARPAGSGQEFVVRRGGDLPALAPEDLNDPAPRFARVYTTEMFSLMGVEALSYTTGSLDTVKLWFQTYDLAKLADSVLRDTVIGAKLTYADRDGNLFDMTKPAADWVSYPTNSARLVAQLPGVTSYRWFGDRSFLFQPDSITTRVKLQQLIERRLDGQWTGYWQGECSGPGCKPDPAPPTGEI